MRRVITVGLDWPPESPIDVLGPEKRRRRTTQEKIAIVQQSFEPGMTVSLVARQHGV
ncbi:transposase, partial [Escherichia coli]|nr:transposase [Escherichia coli]EEX3747674.1 transposase [Escherichia coli]EEY2162743.1 transposase [Escherichia coli]EFF6969427.1 transposase [Escherichia coli]EKF6106454.1 transposase [Escherichia coli]